MNINEVLKSENQGKEYKCLHNNCRVRNEYGTLLFCMKEYENGSKYWREACMSLNWIESEYEELT